MSKDPKVVYEQLIGRIQYLTQRGMKMDTILRQSDVRRMCHIVDSYLSANMA